jgi:TPR repeat protein
MFSLGLHYAKGFGVERNFEKAAYWMQQAADNGDEDAAPIAEEYSKIAATKEKADAGDAQAQADMVGHFTRMASSLDQAGEDEDFVLAFKYAQKSAAQNNGDGIWGLALCYEHGRGVDEDIDKAIELYRKGAELGHAPSQHSLACFFMRGDYLDEDHDAAFELCEKAALQGYKLAEFGLAKMYELGMGCEENLDKALEWGEKAATNGDANTQYEVAKLYTYTNDDGEMIDAERAKYWYSQAAEKGHEMARFALEGPLFDENSDESDEFKAFEDMCIYENELQAEGLLPDAPSADDEPGAFYRVRFMAEEGDEKAVAILETFKGFFEDDEEEFDEE